MTKRSVENEIEEFSEEILSELSPGERTQLMAKAMAANSDEQVTLLTDTAPVYRYEQTDVEFMRGAKNLFFMSLLARSQLRQTMQAIDHAEAARERHVALMLLNECLAERDGFEIDGLGHVSAVDSDPDDPYGGKYDPVTVNLARRYEALWEGIDVELRVGDDSLDIDYFPALVATGLLGYPIRVPEPIRDEVAGETLRGELGMTEIRLLEAVADLYVMFHGFRRFAEDHLGIEMADFLAIAAPEIDEAIDPFGLPVVDEEHCRAELSRLEPYLAAYDTVRTAVLEDSPVVEADADGAEDILEDRVDTFFEELSEMNEIPVLA